MTSLAEDLAHLPPDQYLTCPVATISQSLNLADRLTLARVLGVNTPTSRILARVLKDRGHSISAAQLRRHRRHQCPTCNVASLGVPASPRVLPT